MRTESDSRLDGPRKAPCPSPRLSYSRASTKAGSGRPAFERPASVVKPGEVQQYNPEWHRPKTGQIHIDELDSWLAFAGLPTGHATHAFSLLERLTLAWRTDN